MKFFWKILLVLAGSALLGALTAPFIHSFLNQTGLGGFPYDKLLNRCVLGWIILFLVIFRRGLFPQPLSQMGLARTRGWKGELFYGILLGTVSFILLAALMYWMGARRIEVRLLSLKFLRRFFEFGLAATFIGVFEEIFFRGFILQALLQSQKKWIAVILSSLFYAFAHFLKPVAYDVPGEVSLLYSLQLLFKFLEPLQNLSEIMPHFFGLFLTGIVLAAGYLKTGRLFFSIGLHGAWVYCMKMDVHFILPTRLGGEHWYFGDGKIITGILGWEYMILILLFVYHFVPWKKRDADV